MKIVDIGCGNDKTKGALGIDISPDAQADIIHDLNKLPWPLKDNEFDEIICNDILEHLDDIIAGMREIHRIGKSGALVRIRVPHFSSATAFGDVTHKHSFSSQALDFLIYDNPRYRHYVNIKFKKVSISIKFGKLYKFLEHIINRNQERYERYFAFIFPAGNIEFQFKVVKEEA